jgi:redox-sensitive bicupin YhaK (pirin superfamily)
MKKFLSSHKTNEQHWVGDGFEVRTIFTYNDLAQSISPFLLMDYAAPTEFKASKHIRGVGEHPHRGFETVTIVYDGEVEHRDSAGGGGLIGPGDVQWMTAASGLVHEERHSQSFAQTGGAFEMVQLWVNLPKKYKMTSPRYQTLKNEKIKSFDLPDGAGVVRVIAGEYNQSKADALTFSPVNLWDIRAKAGHKISLQVPEGHSTAVFVLQGQIKLEGDEIIGAAELAVLDKNGTEFSFRAQLDSKILFMGGEPLNEPIVGHGPFVMNSILEIQQAITDFQNGKMGRLTPIKEV